MLQAVCQRPPFLLVAASGSPAPRISPAKEKISAVTEVFSCPSGISPAVASFSARQGTNQEHDARPWSILNAWDQHGITVVAESTRDPDVQPPSPRIHCEECRKEIPPSELDQPEAEDYVIYFCGLECFEKWREDAEVEIISGGPDDPD
jgi:hypothetical protein